MSEWQENSGFPAGGKAPFGGGNPRENSWKEAGSMGNEVGELSVRIVGAENVGRSHTLYSGTVTSHPAILSPPVFTTPEQHTPFGFGLTGGCGVPVPVCSLCGWPARSAAVLPRRHAAIVLSIEGFGSSMLGGGGAVGGAEALLGLRAAAHHAQDAPTGQRPPNQWRTDISRISKPEP